MNEIKPIFCLAGGGFRNPGGMVSQLTHALHECGSQEPRVAYVGTANGDSEPFFMAMKALLKQAGASEVHLVRLAKPKADIPAAKEALETADAIFLSGGEVEDGMRWLERHGLVEYLKDLRSQGKFFFGVSAGSIMMGAHWVRWDDPDDDSTAGLFDCLGFIPTTFDTHAEDEDWKELKMALKLQGPGAFGYGIPRGGLLRVESNGKMESLVETLLYFVNDNGQVTIGGGKHGI
jgi:peptidase E